MGRRGVDIIMDASLPSVHFIPPMLPKLVEEPPSGAGWIHEIKHDGWRLQIAINREDVRAFTRKGLDYSEQMAPLIRAARSLPCASALLDGEVIVQREGSQSDFPALRAAIAKASDQLIFYAFDLLHLDGLDLRRMELQARKARLQSLVGVPDSLSKIQFSEAIAADGPAVFEAACPMELEGIVSKKATSHYRSGVSPAWLKTKCYDETEFVVIGAEREPGKPAFALLARDSEDGLKYAGSAFLTLGGADREAFWRQAERLHQDHAPLEMLRRKKVRWMAPELRVLVQHLRGEGMLRHATVRELR